MMVVILNSTMCWIQPLPSWIQTPSYLLSDSLKNTLTPLWLLTQTNSIWLKLIQSHSTWWWQPSWILPSWIWPSWISAILVFPSQTHSHLPRLVPTICTKKPFTHSFWLNLMMSAFLNSTMLDSDTAILDSDTFLSSLRFTQKHSPSTLTLTQTNSIWLKLILSHTTWWWQPYWILVILDSATLVFPLKLTHVCQDWFSTICTKKTSLPLPFPFFAQINTSLINSDSTWWWQPSWILPSWIQTLPSLDSDYLLRSSLRFTQTHSRLPPWLLVPTICTINTSNSFILTQLDDGSHLEFYHVGFRHCHLGFRHLLSLLSDSLKNTLPHTLTQTNSIWLKLILSHTTWWWQPYWIWSSWIQPP